jgi:hypothetical protein
MAVLTVIFVFLLAFVISIVIVIAVAIVAIMVFNIDRSGNNYGSSMMAMAAVMFHLHWYPNTHPYAHMDLDQVRSCRFRQSELSHSHCQSTKEGKDDCFSMFHYVVMI